MGGDRKSEEKRSRKRSPSSSSEDEGKGKRRRTRDDSERKSRRSDKKEKKKSHKHYKHHSDKEKKTKDKHRSKHHKSLKIDIQELSSDDYFSKNNEFSTWLKEEKDMYFSDLTSQSARELFLDFVKVWNKKKLDIKYYEGIASGPRCASSWIVKA